MRIIRITLLLLSISIAAYTQTRTKSYVNIPHQKDTSIVNELNQAAFKNRLINPELTINQAIKAFKLAHQLNYTNGIGEAYRVIGVGRYYLNQIDTSIENYLNALAYFKKGNSIEGQAKVYNNIGNLYRDIDFGKSLNYFNKSLKLAKKLKIKDLVAGLYLNIGTVNQRMNNYSKALSYFKLSLSMFAELKNVVGIVQSQQNLGLIYLNINKLDIAEKYLVEAKKLAKEHELNNSIASIDLTLSSVYIAQRKFEEAENTISEGLAFAKKVKDPKLEYNFILTSYQLENTRKNYQSALYFLQQVYKKDSITYKSNTSDKINLLEAQHKQLEKQKENELTIAKQKNTQLLLWASSAIAIMAFFVIFLLIKIVRKSAQNNKELSRLNLEISKQKDDLDKINQNLEEVIEDRTKDLKIKNKKLSEYSSHLSHQIRSPVATLKGLILLEKDDLIEQEELVDQISKCIYDLDDKIMNINENLNNPHKSSLINED